MKLLEDRIVKDGVVKEGNVIKVDSFLNHQMDIHLFNEMGKEFKRLFSKHKINKIFTIEASGIGIACIVAQHFDVPVVFAKKSESINLDGAVYSVPIDHLHINVLIMLLYLKNTLMKVIVYLLLTTFLQMVVH